MSRDSSLSFSLLIVLASLAIDRIDADSRGPPLVWTKYGQIRGKWSRSARNVPVANFLGIPYAEPPIGPLRFRNPKPWNHTWLELRDGTREAPECLQLGKNDKVLGSEDCLYLNVFAPVTPITHHHGRLPVMVFLHGGSFSTGKSNSRIYAPDYLMDQEIILVTLNYRLNIFGFLSTESAASPGNYGLKDVVVGLQWIQENIASFNGDAGSVTLFGHDAGAMAAHILALTNRTGGLFHRYAMLSGSALSNCAVHHPRMLRYLSLVLMRKLGCTPGQFNVDDDENDPLRHLKLEIEELQRRRHGQKDREGARTKWEGYTEAQERDMLECMRNVGAREILHPFADVHMWLGLPRCFFGPTVEEDVDGAILTEYPITSIAKSTFRDIPFIMGVTQDEGLSRTIDILVKPALQKELIQHYGSYLPFLCELHEVMVQNSEILDIITDFYFSGNVSANLIPNITKVVGDTTVMWPTYSTLNLQSPKMNSSVYFYVFSYEGTFSSTFKTGSTLHYGVSHGDDLNYLFPYLNYVYKDLQLHNTGNDWTMINIMTEMWTNFAKHGVPEARLTPTWPDYKTKNEFLKFGEGVLPDLTIETEFIPARLELWEKISANITVTPMNLGDLLMSPENAENDARRIAGNGVAIFCLVAIVASFVS